jgi:hypothetical protein
MPVTYEKLKADQKCIYQAFENVVGNKDTPSAMGVYVNKKGIDADDDAAVHELAKKYGLTEIEMFLGQSWNQGDYNLDPGGEYVLTINKQSSMIADFVSAAKAEVALKGETAVREIQKKYANEVGHAIYCTTKKGSTAIDKWVDIQKIYKQPPHFPDKTLVVAYGRKRTD